MTHEALPDGEAVHLLPQQQGMRITPQRLVILRVVASSQERLTIAAIHRRVQAVFPMVNVSTVRRVLHDFARRGVIARTQGAGLDAAYRVLWPHASDPRAAAPDPAHASDGADTSGT